MDNLASVVEIYEMEDNNNEQTRLVNVFTRCIVGTGDEVAIADYSGGPRTTERSCAEAPRSRSRPRPECPDCEHNPNPYLEIHDGTGGLRLPRTINGKTSTVPALAAGKTRAQRFSISAARQTNM